MKINRIKRTDSLDGGFGQFYNNTNKLIDSRPTSAKRRFSFENNSIAKQNTLRVLVPSLNIEPNIFKLKRRKFNQLSDCNLHSTTGGIGLLLAKTPVATMIKGKKRVNRSLDIEAKHMATMIRRKSIEIQPSQYTNKSQLLTETGIIPTGKKHFSKLIRNKNTLFLF